MLNSLQIFPPYRDTWGYFDACVNPFFAPLDNNSCYLPKYYEVPEVQQQVLSPGDYLQYTLAITPGSLIYGWFNDDNAPIFTVMITDISTGHRFWDAPVSNYFLTNDFRYPSLLCAPYPVVGSGNFNVEIWCQPAPVNTEDTRCAFTVGVAEVSPCQ
jgi:hypothetical protein